MTTNSIFQENWWLNAVAPDSWKVIEIYQNQQTKARFPYVLKNYRGLVFLYMPPLTQTLGPWIAPSQASYPKQLAQQKELIESIIAQLPKYDFFRQNFHYSINNWLPFYWNGFSQSTRYTYILKDIENIEKIWINFQGNIRREIKKARKKVSVRDDLDIDSFFEINALSFKRQGISLPYSRQFIHNLDNACVQQNKRRIFCAEDAKGNLHAAIYVVWDERSAYYLMGGANPDLRSSGATSLLMWEAIKFASTVTHQFDFEGSMVKSIERFFRGFGARQIPYFQITNMSKKGRLLWSARELIRASWDLIR